MGTSLLVTHDCDLDKRRGDGSPRVERLQFVPVLDLDELPGDRRQLVTGNATKINPPEVLFIGDLGGWAGYCVLGEMYTLPASIFQPEMVNFRGNAHVADDDPDPFRLRLRTIADRQGCLTQSQLALLHQKMIAFWTRAKPEAFQQKLPGTD